MIARYAASLLANAALGTGAMAATPSISTVAEETTAIKVTSRGTSTLQTTISKIILAFKTIAQSAWRNPRFKTIAVLAVVANEIRGLITVVLYLKTFGLALPI